MRSMNIAFVLLALAVASQAAPSSIQDAYVKKEVLPRQEGDTPSSTSARNTNDTPSPTMKGSVEAGLPTSNSQSGCYCPPVWPHQAMPTPVHLPDNRGPIHLPPVRCKCASPALLPKSWGLGPSTITPAPYRISLLPGKLPSRDKVEARKLPFKIIWDGLKWVGKEIGEAGGDSPTIKTDDAPKTMIDDSQLGAGSGAA